MNLFDGARPDLNAIRDIIQQQCANPKTPEHVTDEVQEERNRQDAKWGGPAHDDTHTPYEWRCFIGERVDKLIVVSDTRFPDRRYRKLLVEIEALAARARESWDRIQAATGGGGGEKKETGE